MTAFVAGDAKVSHLYLMKRVKKQKRQRYDKRLHSPYWRQYLEDADSIPAFRDDCPCTKKKCEKHGRCRECYDYHAAGKLLPYCLR